MDSIAETVKSPAAVTQTTKPQPPKGARIHLWVCRCHVNRKARLIPSRATEIARILNLSWQDLEHAVLLAMNTGTPEVVACLRQRDLAKQKLAQLEGLTPFLLSSCHRFSMTEEE